jgi:hypothetical protein
MEKDLKFVEWKVDSNTSDYNLQRVVEEIDFGYEGKGGINLKPFYQREYKFSKKDESLLIESLLGGIPIPLIYLASDTTKIPHISNVIDGQHRLKAIYRFMKNKFRLKDLKKYKHLEGKNFEELELELQNKLKYQISLTLQFIHTQNDPELELEIFTRYNQGTHPLTKQEIRSVVFNSSFNEWLNIEITNYYNNSESVRDILNITKKRYGDKSIHQELCVMFGVYENLLSPNYSLEYRKTRKIHEIFNGINLDYYSSTEYVDEFMHYAREVEIEDKIKGESLIKKSKQFLSDFLDILRIVYIEADNNVQYPLSKEIYEKVTVRNHKMQTSILMIMTPVIFYVLDKKISLVTQENKEKFREAVKEGFSKSKFPNTTSSTTEPKLVSETISMILHEVERIFA